MENIKNILIKFQEYTLENNILNANFTHNSVANNFLKLYPEYIDKSYSISDIVELNSGHTAIIVDNVITTVDIQYLHNGINDTICVSNILKK